MLSPTELLEFLSRGAVGKRYINLIAGGLPSDLMLKMIMGFI